MKQTIFTLFLITTFLLIPAITANAQENSSNSQGNVPDFNTWTEEQVRQWEDSVKKAIFPEPKIKYVTNAVPREKTTPSTLFEAYYSNRLVPDAYPIDKSKAVGEIPFTSSVSPGGALLYNVPLEIYPGINGFQPQLSLAYNSQAGDGVVGQGWNIGGLSSIARTTRNIYYDNQTQGVEMTFKDAFTLDGIRLIKIEENASQIQYETEQGHIKAKATLNGNFVRYFEVFYPNGQKGIFGYTDNYSNYLEYPLTSLTDPQGNAITFRYTYFNNHYTINSIHYNGASVEFQYILRINSLFFYNSGIKVMENQLLKKIICKFENTTLRSYELSIADYGTPLLTQIDCTASGDSFNPLLFYYGEENPISSYTNSTMDLWFKYYEWEDPRSIRISKGKLNYDSSDDDLIIWPNKTPYWEHYWLFHPSLKEFVNQYEATESIFIYENFENDQPQSLPEIVTENGFIDIFCADLDGTGGEEIVKINNYVSAESDHLVFNVYGKSASAGLLKKYSRSYDFSTVLSGNSALKSIHPKFYYPGDFNGDGKMEIFAVSCHHPFGWTGHPSQCYLFDLEADKKLYEGHAFSYNVQFVGSRQGDAGTAFQNTDRLFVLDYDGDGKTDICLIKDAGTYIYTFDITGTTYSIRQVNFYSGLKKADLNGRDLMPGEFNGDGKVDFLMSPQKESSDWFIFYSEGNGVFEKTAVSIRGRRNADKYMLQDVNSDGLTDLIVILYELFEDNKVYTYLCGNGKFPLNSTIYPGFSNYIFIPTDINSRNHSKHLIGVRNSHVVKYEYTRNYLKDKSLTGVVNSLGVVTKNHYRILNENLQQNETNFYSMGSWKPFPYENFKGPLLVPACREMYVNGQLEEKNTYNYEGAVMHKQGLGFRGFDKITTHNNLRADYTVTNRYDPMNFCLPLSEYSIKATSTNTYSVNVLPNKIAQVRLNSQTLWDRVKQQTIQTSFQYDTYGNPILETTDYGGGISTTISTGFYNNTAENGYLIGIPVDVTRTTYRNGEAWSERTHIPSHNQGLPYERIKYVNGNQAFAETFQYNAQGNVTSKTVKNYTSPIVLTSSFEYDHYGRLKKETDPMNFSTSYEYDLNGSLKNQKNFRGLVTSFEYDAFGRLISTKYPDETSGGDRFLWTEADRPGLYYALSSTTTTPAIHTCYNERGREIRTSQTCFDGSERHVDKRYDASGRLHQVSLPFAGNAASAWNEYSYDSYDRVTSIQEASGRQTIYAYNGREVTTTCDGITSTQSFDTQGNLVAASDPGGTITYNLRPDGQPHTIVAPGDISTSFEYDHYGRQTAITDPSAGRQTYQYDDAGNLSQETDANGKTTGFTYDKYGRLTDKTTPEFDTEYSYDIQTGLLCNIFSYTNQTYSIYVYDNLGRVTAIWEANGLTTLEKVITYSQGNISTIEYTSDSEYGPWGRAATEHYYYLNGYLREIKLDDQVSIWKLNAENSLGQPTVATTGGIVRNYGYNAFGSPTSRTAGSFQHFTYDFDPAKGNLNNRKDARRDIRENFTYDNLNRLSDYGANTSGYDFKGNITRKTDAGHSFEYNTPGKPYALSDVTAVAKAIPLREQNISYTSFKRPSLIEENGYSASFTYNYRAERVRMQLMKDGQPELIRISLLDQYEADKTVAGIKEKLYLGGDYYTAPAVYVRENGGGWQLYYIFRDYLGSITHITNSSGAVVQELSYDAWGRLRDPATHVVYEPGNEPDLFLGRGYTGHEHLPRFGLINMNARLYDPVLGRFLSPDPYIQAPDFTQNFNRYSYCLNNPLKFTDPTGEWFGIDDLLIAGAGFVIGYVGHGISTGNWGGKALAAGGMGAGMAWLGYNTAGMATGAITNATWNQVGGMAINAVANQIMPPMYVPIGDHFGIGISPAFGLGASGLTGGMNLSAYYTNGDLSIGGSIGAGDNYWGWSARATVKGVGGGYGLTYYGNATGPDLQSNAQRVANVTAFWRGGSFTLQNDIKKLGGDGDRWRTNAVELTIGKFSIGSYLYTNDGEAESGNMTDDTCLSKIWGKNRGDYSTWTYGETFSSPVWVGYKHGNQIQRFGYSFRGAQDLQQNGIHKYVGRQNFYTGYNNFKSGFYSYSGYYNPFSLWGY